MVKAQVVDIISQRTGINKEAVKLTVEAFMESVIESLIDGEDVSLRGFGNFIVKKRPKKQPKVLQRKLRFNNLILQS